MNVINIKLPPLRDRENDIISLSNHYLSVFSDGQKQLDNNKRPEHLVRWEQRAMQRFIEKWGRLPIEDRDSFVVPITGTNNPNKIEWPF